VVAALGDGRSGPDRRPDPDQRAWLEAAATAAAVAALMRDSLADPVGSIRELLIALAFKPPAETASLLAQARRLGFELERGAVALCAGWPSSGRRPGAPGPGVEGALPGDPEAMLADAGGGRILGLVPLGAAEHAGRLALEQAGRLAEDLTRGGATVALSTPRRDPADLHRALREAELLVALGERILPAQEETYRLLIGVLLRDRGQLEELRARTVSPLAQYDAEHDTDLLATLQAFLAHHGSTTETAEAMRLHRHTVGYRLSRVHEVSGLSPHESDGRERLGLGLKADQILAADAARAT
ncbi:MAG TPA: helix-turn-helix domain-containing protein, partial [Solirubrobacteraceae bacterium]